VKLQYSGASRFAAFLLANAACKWIRVLALLLPFAISAAAAGDASSGVARATSPDVIIHYFRADGCPHCEHAGAFLSRYKTDARILVRDYEIKYDSAEREKFVRVVEAIALQDAGVPLIVIGDWAVVGYHSDEWTGAQINAQIAHCLIARCTDSVTAILAGDYSATGGKLPVRVTEAGSLLPERVKLPLFGEVAVARLSLPALTVVLGALDGFNPCAMWALIFLLGLLMGVKDRKRMWLLGLTFLFGSGLVYFLIMAAWLNVLLAIGFEFWVRMIVGVVALSGAAWYLYDFWNNPDAACEVSHAGNRQQVLGRLRRFALELRLLPAMIGVLLLAIAVNLIELVCSAGIPAVYTQVLALTPMPAWQYYGYLLLYNVIYMLDDVAVFAVAALTLQISGIGARYARASRLVGGVVLAAVGLMLLFRPQWLAFY
jgi:glutaredoxin